MKKTDFFIERAKKIHGDKYDYLKSEYINSKTKLCIICHEKDENGKEHGEFWQAPEKHLLRGQGCPKCNGKIKKTFDEFIKKAREVHGNKYDYSKVEYKNNHTKVCIICPTHGEFWQTPHNHIDSKQGCPQCSGNKKRTSNSFVRDAKKIHGDKYDYSKVNYNGIHEKVCIICPTHGEFWQAPNEHLHSQGCPKCANLTSQPELDIIEYISAFIPSEWIIHGDRTTLNGKELDIYIPKLHVAIEYNGLRWHSEEFNKDKNYHLNKLKQCNEKGVKLIQIFEDEWLERKEIVLKKIKHILGFNNGDKVYGRKCEVKEVDKHKAYEFLEKNHIQGSVDSTVAFGALYNNEIVAVMLLTQESEGYWNLTRFATDNDKRCIGIAGKLFKAFLMAYNPSYVKSFADRRWTLSEGHNLYTELGFQLAETLKPDYRYVNGQKREHKFAYRKNKLHKKYGVSLELTEHEMTQQLGFYRIYDCGLFRYEWKK